MNFLSPLHHGQIARRILTTAVLLAAITTTAHAQADRDSQTMYAGLVGGSSWMDNQIEDVDGFAHWGVPGWTLDYNDSGLVFGVLAGQSSVWEPPCASRSMASWAI